MGEGWLVTTAWSGRLRWLAKNIKANDNRSHYDLQQLNENDSYLLYIEVCLECLATPSIRPSKPRETWNCSKNRTDPRPSPKQKQSV